MAASHRDMSNSLSQISEPGGACAAIEVVLRQICRRLDCAAAEIRIESPDGLESCWRYRNDAAGGLGDALAPTSTVSSACVDESVRLDLKLEGTVLGHL